MSLMQTVELIFYAIADLFFCLLFAVFIGVMFYFAVAKPIKQFGVRELLDKRERQHTIFYWVFFVIIALLFGCGIWEFAHDFLWVARALSQ